MELNRFNILYDLRLVQAHQIFLKIHDIFPYTRKKKEGGEEKRFINSNIIGD